MGKIALVSLPYVHPPLLLPFDGSFFLCLETNNVIVIIYEDTLPVHLILGALGWVYN